MAGIREFLGRGPFLGHSGDASWSLWGRFLATLGPFLGPLRGLLLPTPGPFSGHSTAVCLATRGRFLTTPGPYAAQRKAVRRSFVRLPGRRAIRWIILVRRRLGSAATDRAFANVARAKPGTDDSAPQTGAMPSPTGGWFRSQLHGCPLENLSWPALPTMQCHGASACTGFLKIPPRCDD